MHIREYHSVYGDTPSENDAIEATTEAFAKAPNAGEGVTDDIKMLSNLNHHAYKYEHIYISVQYLISLTSYDILIIVSQHDF